MLSYTDSYNFSKQHDTSISVIIDNNHYANTSGLYWKCSDSLILYELECSLTTEFQVADAEKCIYFLR